MKNLKICNPANRWASRERERERESYSLEEVSANEVSAVNNGIKLSRAMYSMGNTIT